MTMSDESIEVFLFKASFGPFLQLLNEHKVAYSMRLQRSGTVVASTPGVLELLQSAAMWGALASVVVAYLNSRRSREVTITLKDHTVVQAKGLSMAELESVLRHAENLSVIDTGSSEDKTASPQA